MSHFSTLVIVPKETSDLEGAVEALMAPYSENLEVQEYDRECYCIGLVAKNESYEAANREVGTIDSFRERYHDELYKRLPANIRSLLKRNDHDPESLSNEEVNTVIDAYEAAKQALPWQEWIQPYKDAYQRTFDQHPMREMPDPECDTCEGTGSYRSTYNPKSKWDWYQIGGRWSGMLCPDYDPEKDPENIETCFMCGGSGMRNDQIGREARMKDPTYTCNGCNGTGRKVKWPTQWVSAPGNDAPVSVVLELIERGHDVIPFAIVTPDGEWHERGEMGWFGISSNNREDWDEAAVKLLKLYANHVAVVVDCHI